MDRLYIVLTSLGTQQGKAPPSTPDLACLRTQQLASQEAICSAVGWSEQQRSGNLSATQLKSKEQFDKWVWGY